MTLNGSVAIVTGGNRGLGARFVVTLLISNAGILTPASVTAGDPRLTTPRHTE